MSGHVDHAKLEQIVGILCDAAAHLDEVAARAPERPNGGPYAKATIGATRHMLDSQADLVAATAVDALLVAEALLAYAVTDAVGADTLERIAQRMGASDP